MITNGLSDQGDEEKYQLMEELVEQVDSIVEMDQVDSDSSDVDSDDLDDDDSVPKRQKEKRIHLDRIMPVTCAQDSSGFSAINKALIVGKESLATSMLKNLVPDDQKIDQVKDHVML